MKVIKTTDLALVALLSLEFNIIEMDRGEGGRVTFSFEETPKLNKAMAKYWALEARVEPQKYFNQIRLIKSRIYNNG